MSFRGARRLVASSLDIPGIGSNGLHVDNGGNLGIGGATATTGPFKVSSAGALTATGVTVTGSINATTGDVSGTLTVSGTLNVTTGKIIGGAFHSPDDSSQGFHVSTAGVMGVGGTTAGNSPFSVASNGTVTIDVNSGTVAALRVSNTTNKGGNQFEWTFNNGALAGWIDKFGAMMQGGGGFTVTTNTANPLAAAAQTTQLGAGNVISQSIQLYKAMNDATPAAMLDVSIPSNSKAGIELGIGTGRDVNLYRDQADRLKTDDSLHVALDFRHLGTALGFYGTAVQTKQTVTGSRAANAALNSLVQALATYGLITNSTTA